AGLHVLLERVEIAKRPRRRHRRKEARTTVHRLRLRRKIAPPAADRRKHEIQMPGDFGKIREVILRCADRRIMNRVAKIDFLPAGEYEYRRRFPSRRIE